MDTKYMRHFIIALLQLKLLHINVLTLEELFSEIADAICVEMQEEFKRQQRAKEDKNE